MFELSGSQRLVGKGAEVPLLLIRRAAAIVRHPLGGAANEAGVSPVWAKRRF